MSLTRFFMACSLILVGCGQPDQQFETDTVLSGRELKPAKSDIRLGSLYYVKEAPVRDAEQPADLQDLCIFPLDDDRSLSVTKKRIGDLNLLRDLKADGKLSGIEFRLAKLGLQGDVGRYYSYTLKNAREISLPLVDAQNLFDSKAFLDKCSGWRANIAAQGWAAYQILSYIEGDLVLERESGGRANAEASLKLAEIEPELRAELEREIGSKYEGKALVMSFNPILRNQIADK